MTWEQVQKLFWVIESSRDYPKLRGIHDRAVAELEAVDANELHFRDQVDALEPLGEPEEDAE